MRKVIASCIVLSAMMMANVNLAHAEGCLKGAAVGAAAGHLKNHTVAGAVAGCAIGHHLAKVAKEKKQAELAAKHK